MEIIEKLPVMIGDELADAEKYARCALKAKAEHPDLADLFHRLSMDEMEHMNLLHEAAAKIVADVKAMQDQY